MERVYFTGSASSIIDYLPFTHFFPLHVSSSSDSSSLFSQPLAFRSSREHRATLAFSFPARRPCPPWREDNASPLSTIKQFVHAFLSAEHGRHPYRRNYNSRILAGGGRLRGLVEWHVREESTRIRGEERMKGGGRMKVSGGARGWLEEEPLNKLLNSHPAGFYFYLNGVGEIRIGFFAGSLATNLFVPFVIDTLLSSPSIVYPPFSTGLI